MKISNFKAPGLFDKTKKYKVRKLPIIATLLTPLIISNAFRVDESNLGKYIAQIDSPSVETELLQTPTSTLNLDSDDTDEFYESNADNKTTNGDVPILIDGSEELLKVFESELNEIQNEYEFADYYDIDECLNEYQKSFNANQKVKHTGKLKELSVDELYQAVLKNNEAEFAKSSYERGNLYKELDNDDIYKICQIIIKTIKSEQTSPTFDLDRTLCVLSNLKIVKDTGTISVAGVDSNLYLKVNPNMVSVFSIMTSNSKEESFEETICHEAEHLIQMYCPDMTKYGKNIGISFESDNVKVNGLSSIWLNEAVAEKKGSAIAGEKPETYLYQLGYVYALEAAAIIDDDNSEDCICDLTYTNDLNELYRVFNCETEEEKREILNMMYSITIQQDGPEDFYDVYPGEEEQDGVAILQRNLRGSIFTTLAQKFYSNLANEIQKEDTVTLQDAFFLIYNFERVTSLKTQYSQEVSYERYKEFLNNYVKIQDSFFEYVAESNNMSYDEVLNRYEQYALHTKSKTSGISNGEEGYNCTLKWLSQDKIDELKSSLEFTQENSTGTIRSVVAERNLTDKMIKS